MFNCFAIFFIFLISFGIKNVGRIFWIIYEFRQKQIGQVSARIATKIFKNLAILFAKISDENLLNVLVRIGAKEFRFFSSEGLM